MLRDLTRKSRAMQHILINRIITAKEELPRSNILESLEFGLRLNTICIDNFSIVIQFSVPSSSLRNRVI